MLINCPECNTEVSDKATACPKCGNPLMFEQGDYTTTQLTGKSIKLVKAASFFLFIAALFIGMVGEGSVAVPMFIIAAFIYIIARVYQWWQHE